MNEPTENQPHVRRFAFLGDVATLNPAYFALVMATGIVSIACHLLGMAGLARGLFWVNIGAFAVLWALHFLRIIGFSREMFADLIDHKWGVGFFTSVAASCVLGTQCLVIAENRGAAVALWALGITLWILLTDVIFTSLAVKEAKPSLPEGIRGGWLVSVVATQAVALLASMLAAGFSPYSEHVLFSHRRCG